MAEDDKGMGFKEGAGGVVLGAGVGYGVSAINGKKLKNVKFTDLVKEPLEAGKAGGKALIEGTTKLFADHKITPATLETAYTRAMLKAGEKMGFDAGPFLTKMQNLKKYPEFNPDKIGELFKDLLEYAKAGFKKAPTVHEQVQLSNEFKRTFAETIAETAGKTGAEKEKLVTEYLALGEKEMKSFLSTLENSGRKLVGAVKYEKASWMKKPLVAFESMSTKGKVGLGALVTASALGAAYAINSIRSGKETETPSR